MNNPSYALRKSEILSLLADNRLFEAVEAIRPDVDAASLPALRTRFENTSQTLRYLTGYFVQGTPDPHRESMLGTIRADLADLAEEVYTTLTYDTDPSRRMATLRMGRLSGRLLQDMLDDYGKAAMEYSIMLETRNHEADIMLARERAIKEIFDYVWSVPSISQADAQKLLSSVSSDPAGDTLGLMTASALTLSLIQSPVSSKIRLLFSLYDQAEDDRLAARAMTGVIMLLARWGEMAVAHPEVKGRLESWQDSPLAYCRVRDVVMAMIRAFDTKRVSRILKEDLMPDLMKMQPDIQKMMRQANDTFDPSEGFNPEWEEKIEKSGLADKLRKMSEIQEDGGDIMMNFIGSLKSHPFFREVANWFAPFEIFRSELSEDTDILGRLFSITDRASLFCDSDKYSLALAVRRFPAGMFNDQMAEQLRQAREEALDSLSETTPDFAAEVKNSVKGLYRFLRLAPMKSEFEDVFNRPVSPVELPVIGESLFDDEFKKLIYSFLFRNGYYDLALPYLESLDPDADDCARVYQQIGFCYQKLGRHDKAVESYRKAEIFDSSNTWLRKSIATCLMHLGNYDGAAKFFEDALQDAPDDKELLHSAGEAAMMAGDPDRALAHLYKSYFLSLDSEDLPLIAWGEFLRGDYIKSADYWRQAIEGGCADPQSLLRASYASMALGDIPAAVSMLRMLKEKDPEAISVSEADVPAMLKAGIPKSDLQLLMQYIRFDTL